MPDTDTLSLVRAALAGAASPEVLAKASTFTQPGSATTGLQTYDLEAPAKNLVSHLTPLRDSIPRVKANGSTQANWKAVTAYNSQNVFTGLAEGRRGQMIDSVLKEYFAAYRGFGQESAVTFEADYSAEGFDDLRARAQMQLLKSVMREEERSILGGNTSLQLGITPTPTVTAQTSGGAIPNTTVVSVICVALTLDGVRRSAVATSVKDVLTITPTDGQGTFTAGGGSAQKSAAASVTTAANGAQVTAVVAPVRGAFGYAWYWGAAGSEALGAITSSSKVIIATATGAGSQTAASCCIADNSTSSLVYDGLLTIGSNATYGSNWVAQPAGTGLTADGTGAIVEFDTMLQYFWDQLKIQPSRIWISSQEMKNIRAKVLGMGATVAAQRFTFNVQQNQIVGGGAAKGYLNPFSMDGPSEIPLKIHPDLPAGTVLFDTDDIPYPMNNITNMKQIRLRKEYHSMEWPLRTRQYEYGVYHDGVLQHYYPPSMGIITNIANA